MDSGWRTSLDWRRVGRGSAGFLVGAWLLHSPAAAAPRVVECRLAVMVDGELRCGPEVAAELARRCGGPVYGVRAGDQIQTPAACAGGPGGQGWGRMGPDDLAAHRVVLDVNRDSLEDLTSLPGVGPVIAERMVHGRPYADLDGLLEVPGIGPVRLEAMRGRVRVGP